MRLLLDTHCWLWFLLTPERLNEEARKILIDNENEIFFSAASTWEIVIKFGLSKLKLPQPPSEYIPDRLTILGHESLPIRQEHVLRIEGLPSYHRDPFDRILVAQAQAESLQLMTADRVLTAYDVPILWAGRDDP
ncbi:MAG TPA: type II toxin-antitoxin system VapC family toxin [Thermoanaerobaculia bacterium]|nr:type II toxin-antitoxin system VapC family toxin [Thermoanaerobaculia bacterium]